MSLVILLFYNRGPSPGTFLFNVLMLYGNIGPVGLEILCSILCIHLLTLRILGGLSRIASGMRVIC